MEIVYVFIKKEKSVVKSVMVHKYVYIIIANMEKSNITAGSVSDRLFVNMVNKKQDVKRAVERVYAKHHCAKLELVKIAKAYVLVASFIRTPTNQTLVTTRPKNAPWSISC